MRTAAATVVATLAPDILKLGPDGAHEGLRRLRENLVDIVRDYPGFGDPNALAEDIDEGLTNIVVAVFGASKPPEIPDVYLDAFGDEGQP